MEIGHTEEGDCYITIGCIGNKTSLKSCCGLQNSDREGNIFWGGIWSHVNVAPQVYSKIKLLE